MSSQFQCIKPDGFGVLWVGELNDKSISRKHNINYEFEKYVVELKVNKVFE